MPASKNPFRYFNSSPEVIRLVVMMYVGESEMLTARALTPASSPGD